MYYCVYLLFTTEYDCTYEGTKEKQIKWESYRNYVVLSIYIEVPNICLMSRGIVVITDFLALLRYFRAQSDLNPV